MTRIAWTSLLWCLYAAVLLPLSEGGSVAQAHDYATMSRAEAYTVLQNLYTHGKFIELEQVARQIVEENPALVTEPSQYPDIYEYLGVAQYSMGKLDQAVATFEEAVKTTTGNGLVWVHLGNCYLYRLRIAEAVKALEVAVFEKGLTSHLHELLKARNWIADWRDREDNVAQVLKIIENDITNTRGSSATPLDLVELDAALIKPMTRYQLQYKSKVPPMPSSLMLFPKKLRVGFVSSDFGVHPVVTLMRGLLAMLTADPTNDIIVYCFALNDEQSWWRQNITRSVDHMISLTGKEPAEAASIIHSHSIHVLIDLNGHTLHSGLPIFTFRPAPVQISFLGYPMTTGSPYMDYFIADPVSTPPEAIDVLFTEKMLLLPTHYIVNDYAQMMGHTTQGNRPFLSTVAPHIGDGEGRPFVFATFSNWQKMDPYVFSAWMAILARVPSSVMWFIRSKGSKEAEVLLRQEAFGHGIDGEKRFVFTDMLPWIHHTQGKRVADLILDTTLKNGHTTIIDALWAGVPVITLEGNRMSNRAGGSALHALRLHHLAVNSIKEYVDIAVQLATNPGLLARLRATTEQHRLAYPLFDTPRFTDRFSAAVRSAWYVSKTQRERATRPRPDGSFEAMHVFHAVQDEQSMKPHLLEVHSAAGTGEKLDAYEHKVLKALVDGTKVMLHIGGHQSKDGWWIVDLDDRENVDFMLPMHNLYAFPDSSVCVIYASHILEHAFYDLNEEMRHTLAEWHRVLRPGGILFVAVPDLEVLSSLFLNETISDQDRYHVMRIIFGGQTNEYDVHKVGFNFKILAAYLTNAGFCDIKRVGDFNLFVDASSMRFHGTPISLNVVARVCNKDGEPIEANWTPS